MDEHVMEESYHVIIADILRVKPRGWEEAVPFLENLNPTYWPNRPNGYWVSKTDLVCAFGWGQTPQGYGFWDTIYEGIENA